MEEFDWVIIGSGFGGSVSALRLSEKGYKVAVLEAGRRWKTEDYPKTNWSLRKFLWLPQLFCYGIQRLTLLDDVLVLSGAGVGGGSLVYANTLLIPPAGAFQESGWPGGVDWRSELAPHYDMALRMLGAVEVPRDFPADLLLKATAEEIGMGDTYRRQQVGVFFTDEPGTRVPDPYFDGEGPDRSGCVYCGGCMSGCRFGAKNTLDKNYLWLAEKKGTKVFPETIARELRAVDGGYEVHTVRSTSRLRRNPRVFKAKRIVVSAGVLGTLRLLMKSQQLGGLPELSPQLGRVVRTNNESIIGSTARSGDVDYSEGIAIASSVHIDEDTHIEAVRYAKGSDAMSLLGTILADGGGSVPRTLRWLSEVVRHPIDFLRTLTPFGWAKRTVILLVMQFLEGSVSLRLKRRWWWPWSERLASRRNDAKRIPTYLPQANDFARRMAKRQGGFASSSLNEVLLDVPITAHVLGGVSMGNSAEDGVVDQRGQAHGHPGLYVVDGSIVPSNLGVNPSLTITALAEYIMSHIDRIDGES